VCAARACQRASPRTLREKTGRTLVRRRLVLLVALDPQEEVARAALLEEAHQRARDGLALGRRDLGDAVVAQDVRAGDLLELEVARDIGVDEHLGHLAVGHHAVRGEGESAACAAGRQRGGREHAQLGDEVDGVVAVAAEVGGRLGAAKLLVELRASKDAGERSAQELDAGSAGGDAPGSG